MPYAALTYDILPGHEDAIAEIFGSFRRVGSADVPEPGAGPVSRILATALFIRDATMVRMVEYEGDLETIARHMAVQPGIQEMERRIKPYLASPRPTGTVEGFVETFMRSRLRSISQLSVRDVPAAG
ncbi:SchA/CurD-like domain-containing protein [uncultured Pseudonocardia sp.]|uniref:SchA/CurD-like domain-containing protein n=1 Tax=uncultured Pseudonocardia sp. TaxID=211455 RepID=UPI002620CF37|nr:SchA/CurD-like domain-containing protein [uncultured Pseudonocardia sp.]